MHIRESIAILLTLLSFAHALLPEEIYDVLVVIEDETLLTTHSRFIDSLVDTAGKTIDIVPASEELKLFQDGEYRFEAVILLCPTAANMDRRLPVSSLIRFVDSGRSLFVAASHGFSTYTEKVAESIGVDMDTKANKIVDHVNVFEELDDGSHTFVRAGGRAASEFLFGDSSATDIVFTGPGATLFSDNELVDNVLWGSGSCYSTNGKPLVKIPRVAGSGCVLAAALSTRTGSRATYFGSFEALSNDVFDKAGKRHEDAMVALLAWTVGHKGVLRAQNLIHSNVDDSGRVAKDYRVKDTIEFAIDLQSWDGENEAWVPYVTDDVQVEFTMMNPWVRERLRYTGNENGTYTARIPVPDQIGVYKFDIQYFRPGVSPLTVSEVVPVRPFLHNEYERFIGMATPYYVASFSMLIGVFALVLVVLYGGQNERVGVDKSEVTGHVKTE